MKGKKGSGQGKEQKKRNGTGEEATDDDKRDGCDGRGVVKRDYEWEKRRKEREKTG
jgi:hypothetical protein